MEAVCNGWGFDRIVAEGMFAVWGVHSAVQFAGTEDSLVPVEVRSPLPGRYYKRINDYQSAGREPN
eukprot:1184985-Pyramimonas_sp.AAC.2